MTPIRVGWVGASRGVLTNFCGCRAGRCDSLRSKSHVERSRKNRTVRACTTILRGMRRRIMELPPRRITTRRLVIRCWESTDAAALRAAVDSSLEHLRPWMPWAMDEPSTMEETEARLSGYSAKFAAGEDFTFGLFNEDESEVVGSSGLHTRLGEGGLEIGYWIRADRIGLGLATEAVRALTTAGFSMDSIERIQIHCAPENVRSARVPEKLGYRLVERRKGDERNSDGSLRDTLVFRMLRREWERMTSRGTL